MLTLDNIRPWLPVSPRLLSWQQILHEATEIGRPHKEANTVIQQEEKKTLLAWRSVMGQQRNSGRIYISFPSLPNGPPWPRRRSRMWSQSKPTSSLLFFSIYVMVALLEADPPSLHYYSTNTHICNQPLYIALTFELNVQISNYCEFRMSW